MEKESTCTLLIISIVKKLQKEQNSKNLTIVAHSSRMTSLYPFCSLREFWTVWTTVGIDWPNFHPTKICELHRSEGIAAIVGYKSHDLL